MEPRPQRPSRATGPFISTGTPSPSSAAPGSGSGTGGFGQPPFDASGAPSAPPPAIGYDPDYSPGQPLTPLRGPRGANIVGPLLAVAALAIIIAAAAFIVSQFRGGGGNDARPTEIAGAILSPTAESSDDGDEVDGGAGVGETPPDDASQPTEEDDPDAGPTSTPRVNRATEAPGENPAPTEDDADPDASASEANTRARQWFPAEDEVGEGYTQSDNGTRDAAGVAGSFPNADDAAVKLEEFGWAENAYREYSLTDGADTDTIVVSVSIHRFGSEGGASDALTYFAEGSGLAPVEDAPGIGEESVTVQGVTEGGNIYVIYVREGRFVFRIGGFSTAGDPAEVTSGVTERILAA